MASSYKVGTEENPPVTRAALESTLANLRERAAADPFSNPIVLFALDLTRRIDRGDISQDDLDRLIRDLTVDAFAGRASRLGAYLGETDPAANRAAIVAHLTGLA
jgi:phosphoenolpyruvate carboxylase